ncbi:MFS transporter [Massilia sp. TN1-12]|uniref:MFS transporter n=1 Tax=Massilia paldalensis TaxID=3377675 RepID=UPI00384BD6EE
MSRDDPPRAAAMRRRRAIGAAVACNVLEFFDFVAYAFFAAQIGRAFFPSREAGASLLLSVAVFGVGFVARPVGSVVIGRFADRAGRRPALYLTAILMTCATLGLAFTPDYAAIGVAAPIIFTALRLLQGFALGGDIGPSTAFLLEIAPPGRRASYVALQFVSQGLAGMLAAAIGLALFAMLDDAAMDAWGWRVPFACGLLLVPVAVYLRIGMPETLPSSSAPVPAPVRWRVGHVIMGIGAIAGGTVATYVASYMATYGTTVLHLPAASGLHAALAVGLATVAGGVAGGWLADRFGRWPAMFWPRLAMALAVVPAFMLLAARRDPATLLAVAAALAFLTALNGGGVLTAICELFPSAQRAAGLAFVYSAGVSLFGGATQFLVTWLIGATGDPLAPAWCVVAASLVSLAAILRMPETRPAPTV